MPRITTLVPFLFHSLPLLCHKHKPQGNIKTYMVNFCCCFPREDFFALKPRPVPPPMLDCCIANSVFRCSPRLPGGLSCPVIKPSTLSKATLYKAVPCPGSCRTDYHLACCSAQRRATQVEQGDLERVRLCTGPCQQGSRLWLVPMTLTLCSL